jgi:hypothetical protein
MGRYITGEAAFYRCTKSISDSCKLRLAEAGGSPKKAGDIL